MPLCGPEWRINTAKPCIAHVITHISVTSLVAELRMMARTKFNSFQILEFHTSSQVLVAVKQVEAEEDDPQPQNLVACFRSPLFRLPRIRLRHFAQESTESKVPNATHTAAIGR